MEDLTSPPLILEDLRRNFPLPSSRAYQENVLQQMADAWNSGYRHILLEAPTDFGKSLVAIAVGLTLESSYICTSTPSIAKDKG